MTARVLVTHDAEADCGELIGRLTDAGHEVDVADGVGPACFMLRRHDYVVVIADLGGAGVPLLRRTQALVFVVSHFIAYDRYATTSKRSSETSVY